MATRPHWPANTPAGFTLIELMVTVAVVAILASLASAAYTSQIRKSRRTEARTALLDLAAREERYSSTNSSYTDSTANLGYTGTFPQSVGNGYYQISVCVSAALPCGADAGTGAAFLLTATPAGPQATDTTCGSFKLDSTGTQTVTGTATASTCWN
jgi:type IV pilus assembly protein PilE